jgi:hypothetical protein
VPQGINWLTVLAAEPTFNDAIVAGSTSLRFPIDPFHITIDRVSVSQHETALLIS